MQGKGETHDMIPFFLIARGAKRDNRETESERSQRLNKIQADGEQKRATENWR